MQYKKRCWCLAEIDPIVLMSNVLVGTHTFIDAYSVLCNMYPDYFNRSEFDLDLIRVKILLEVAHSCLERCHEI